MRRRRRCRQESLRFSERFSFPPDIPSAFARATSGARRRKRKKGRRSESRVGSNICARKSCDETGDFQMELLINNDNNNKKRNTGAEQDEGINGTDEASTSRQTHVAGTKDHRSGGARWRWSRRRYLKLLETGARVSDSNNFISVRGKICCLRLYPRCISAAAP